MKQSAYYIELDVEKHEAQGCMSVRLGESGRRLTAALMSGGRPYDPGDGCYAVFAAIKPDGKRLFNSCTLASGRIGYTLTAQTTAAAGRLACEFRVYGEDGELIVSPCFSIYVYETAAGEDELASGSEATALSVLISEARRAIADCSGAPLSTASATVDESTGTPSVELTYTESDEERKMNFAFSGLKGAPFRYEDFTPEQLAALKGEKGESAISLTIGSVETAASSTQAAASITGSSGNMRLNLTLPRGQDGGLSYSQEQRLSPAQQRCARANAGACCQPYESAAGVGTVSISGSTDGPLRCRVYGRAIQTGEAVPSAPAEIACVSGSTVSSTDTEKSFSVNALYGLSLGAAVPGAISANAALAAGVCDYGTAAAHDYYICDTAENSAEADGERKNRMMRRVAVQTLTGTENVIFSANGPSIVIDTPLAAANSANLGNPVLCTHFTRLSGVSEMAVADDWILQGSKYSDGDAKRIRIKSTGSWTDAASAKAWLAAQYAAGTPVKVCYVLASPTAVLGAESRLDISGSAASLTSTSSVPPYMSVEYPADIMALIDELKNAILSMGGNI